MARPKLLTVDQVIEASRKHMDAHKAGTEITVDQLATLSMIHHYTGQMNTLAGQMELLSALMRDPDGYDAVMRVSRNNMRNFGWALNVQGSA